MRGPATARSGAMPDSSRAVCITWMRAYDTTAEASTHRLRQIASDSSLKIPERWLAPMRELRAAGHDTPALTGALAAWAHHTRHTADLDDPAADRLRAAWYGTTPQNAVRALLTVLGAADLAADDELTADVAARVADLGRPGLTT
jgi:fructuronate reductase